jgi:DNA-binding NtrC family response regulator
LTERDTISRLPSVIALHERRYSEALALFPKDFALLEGEEARLQLQLRQASALLGAGFNQEARELYFDIFRACREARFEGDLTQLGRKALMNAGLATKNLGEFETAVQFYQSALAQDDPDSLGQELRMRNMLGSLLTRLNRLDEADAEFNIAYMKLQQNMDEALYSDLCLNRAVLAYHLKHDQAAENWLLQAKASAGEDPERLLRVEMNLGTLLMDQAKKSKAWLHLDKARDLAERAKLQSYLPLILAKQALLRDDDRLHAEAVELARRSLEIAEDHEIDVTWIHETCQQIIEAHTGKRTDDFGLANVLISSHGMVAVSGVMRRIIHDIEAFSNSDLPVLILGETGTGKELVAAALHNAGSRKSAPFIPVNCPAIPETLFESTLFGHVKGAFTGADRDRDGLVELAKDGSIFLDEIGDLPLSIQPKLLRFLESGEYHKMGSSRRSWSSARILAATNRNLDELMSTKLFRDDLIMRVSAFRIELPALRDRREDIYFIAASLLDELNKRHSKKTQLSPEALKALNDYNFPGNVRELRNALLRGFQVAKKDIEAEHLGISFQRGFRVDVTDSIPIQHDSKSASWLPKMVAQMELPDNLGLEDALLQLEKRLIVKALEVRSGDRQHTAEDLGLSFRALKYKIAKHGIKSRKRRVPIDGLESQRESSL